MLIAIPLAHRLSRVFVALLVVLIQATSVVAAARSCERSSSRESRQELAMGDHAVMVGASLASLPGDPAGNAHGNACTAVGWLPLLPSLAMAPSSAHVLRDLTPLALPDPLLFSFLRPPRI